MEEWVLAQAKERAATPEEQLLIIFDLFGEWSAEEDFEGCSFINVLLEFSDEPEHPIHQACITALIGLRSVLSSLATAAGLRDPEEFALSWHILMKGSIVQAAEGDLDAAKRAQTMGRLLIESRRRPKMASPSRLSTASVPLRAGSRPLGTASLADRLEAAAISVKMIAAKEPPLGVWAR